MECIRVTWRRKMGKKNNKKGLFPLFCCLAKASDTPLHSLLCTLWPFQTPLTFLLLDSCLIWKCWDHTHRCTEVHFCFTATLKKRYNKIKKKVSHIADNQVSSSAAFSLQHVNRATECRHISPPHQVGDCFFTQRFTCLSVFCLSVSSPVRSLLTAVQPCILWM